jgi:aarF domain-containing kinase
MSFEEGKQITNMEHLKKNNIRLKEISNILSDVFNRQIFEFGFVHVDPHQGNLYVRKDNETGQTKLVLLDHGLYKKLDYSFRYNYAQLWRGILTQNKDLIRESCLNLGVKKVELFMSILTSVKYDDIMNKDHRYVSRKRLSNKSN